MWSALQVTSSCVTFFFFNDTATTEIYTLSLHDALPISSSGCPRPTGLASASGRPATHSTLTARLSRPSASSVSLRSEEHTSELQSHLNLVCRLLLEKKNSDDRSHMFRESPHEPATDSVT